MKKCIGGLVVFGLWAGLMITAAWGQDFQKNYPLAPGGAINIANVSGEISISGYNGTGVTVTAKRVGRDANVVQILDQSTPGKVMLGVQYPHDGGNYDASVNFVVQVPSGPNYQFESLSTASGDIKVSGVAGDLHAKTASGDVTIGPMIGSVDVKTASGDVEITDVQGTVKASAASGDVKIHGVAGTVNASTASGDVDVELIRIEGTGDLKFSSASGDVTVKVPAQLSAQVEMSTVNGSVKTDFPLTIEELKPNERGQKATGLLGSGAVKLTISTASGDVKLIR